MRNRKVKVFIVCLLAFCVALCSGAAIAEDKQLAKKIDALLGAEFLDRLPMIMAWRSCEIALGVYAELFEEAARMAENRNDERSGYILGRADDFLMSDVSERIAELYSKEYTRLINDIYEKLAQGDPAIGKRKAEVEDLIDACITRMIASAGRYMEGAQQPLSEAPPFPHLIDPNHIRVHRIDHLVTFASRD
jgi:hypothetical protein